MKPIEKWARTQVQSTIPKGIKESNPSPVKKSHPPREKLVSFANYIEANMSKISHQSKS